MYTSKPYYDFLNDLGLASWLFYPMLLSLLTVSVALIFGRFVAFAAIYLILFMTFVEFFDPLLADQLEWAYLGWLLAALALEKFGVDRRLLVNLGWYVGGVTFWLHGVAKLMLAGGDWTNGRVIYYVLLAVAPNTIAWFFKIGVGKIFCVGLSYVALFMHFSALPCSLFPKLRKYFWVEVILFHLIFLLSWLNFVSLGMLAFWTYLAADFNLDKSRSPG